MSKQQICTDNSVTFINKTAYILGCIFFRIEPSSGLIVIGIMKGKSYKQDDS